MRWLVPASFRWQIAIVGAASTAVVGLASLLIRDAVLRTEGRLVGEGLQQCRAVCQELSEQYRERNLYGGEQLDTLPREALEISLAALSATVLRAYDGIEAGFYQPDGGAIAGRSYPTRAAVPLPPLAPEEIALIRAAAAEAAGSGTAARTLELGRDAVVVAATADAGGLSVWALKRLPAVRDPVGDRRRIWIAALVLSVVLGTGGVVSIWFYLRAGIREIDRGLRRLEQDFTSRLPAVRGDLGQIAVSINRMAARRAALEEELRRQDRLAARGKAAAGVAHEVRNPLNSIRLTLELLDRRLKSGRATKEEVEAAIAEIDRLDRIVARLLAFGRPDTRDRRVQDLAPIVRRAVDVARTHAAAMPLEWVFDPAAEGDLFADVDGPQIEQVLINLLLNAVEALPSRVEIGASRSNGRVVITVRDDGSGISANAQPHVFDAYFTTKPNGTGLGLAVSREIARSHGGDLTFASGATGTTFRLELPCRRDDAG